MALTKTEKIGFGAGDMAIAIVMMSVHLLLAYFYTDVYGLSAADVGVLMLTVRILDAVIDPMVGLLTDKVTSRWGRYRHYLLFFSVPFGFSIYLMFVTPDVGYTGKLLWAYMTYALMTVMYTFISIPYISLIGVISDEPRERLNANGYRFVMTKIAMFLVSIVVPTLAIKLGGENLTYGYEVSMALMGLLATALCLWCFFTVRERVENEKTDLPVASQFKYLFKNDQWKILVVVIMVLMIGVVIRSSVSAYYAKYFLGGGDALIAPFLTCGVIASVLSMVFSTWVTNYVDKIKLFRVSQIAAAVIGVLMFYCVGENSVALAFVFYFLVVFIADLQLPIYWSSIAEAVDYGEAKTGQRISGLSYGGILFAQKLGMGLAGGAVGFLLNYFNYQAAGEQSEQALYGINMMMTVIPSLFSLAVGVVMYRYVINDAYYQEIKCS